MCGLSVPLVMHGPRRQVRRCSCGALHVLWDGLNLSLQGDEWADLCLLALTPAAPETLGLWHLHWGERTVGLWYGPFGATFARTDWDAFAGLLASADLTTAPPSPRDFYVLN